jgi:histidyl-tRNA synthetase
MKDIEPAEMRQRIWVQERILEVLRRYGYRIMEPTPIENLETLEAKCGPDIRNEIYWFKDKAGRNLGLRFDLTVGMTRMVANRYDLPEPIKICAISGMWRYDEPQFARYRFFHQWDAEIYGSAEPEADADAICVGMDVLENVGLREYEVRISNRRLIEGYLNRIGLTSQDRVERVIRVVDKLRKMPRSDFMDELRKTDLDGSTLDRVLSFVDLNGKPDRVLPELERLLGTSEDLATKGYKELTRLFEVLEGFRKVGKCILDMSTVRGIGYYDGIVFEAFDKGGEDIGAVFGGGRYDKLSLAYGKRDIPATGVAGGIERLMISLERASVIPQLPSVPRVFVAAVNDESRKKVWDIVQKLRDEGLSTDFDMRKRSLRGQIEYANAMKTPFVVIVGPREIAQGVAKVRDTAKHTEVEVEVERIREIVSAPA